MDEGQWCLQHDGGVETWDFNEEKGIKPKSKAGMMYKGQEVSTKEIGVDTAQCLMIVDGQSDMIHTRGDGYWGHCQEFSRKVGNEKYVDAIVIHFSMPEFDSYQTVRQRLQYFFGNVRPAEKQEKKTLDKKTPER